MSTETAPKPVTTGDPQFVNFCVLQGIYKIFDLVVFDDNDPDLPNKKGALMSAKHATAYLIKSLANQIFEPNETENNG